MKKKIFSIITCFMLCFSAMFMMTGCGDEEDDKTPISEVEAMEIMTSAMTAMEEETIISMTGEMSLTMYDETISMAIETVATEEESYMSVYVSYDGIFSSIVESWYKQEDVWVMYTKSTETSYEEVEPLSQTDYIKQILTDFENPKDSTIGQYTNKNLGDFISAYVKDGETVITFEQIDELGITEGGEIKLTVKDGKIRKVKFTILMMSIECNLKYGDEVTETIPGLPSPEEGWTDVSELPGGDIL